MLREVMAEDGLFEQRWKEVRQQGCGDVGKRVLSRGFRRLWLLACPFSLSLLSLAPPDKATCHAVGCPVKRPLWQGTKPIFRLTVRGELRLSPRACWAPTPANN